MARPKLKKPKVSEINKKEDHNEEFFEDNSPTSTEVVENNNDGEESPTSIEAVENNNADNDSETKGEIGDEKLQETKTEEELPEIANEKEIPKDIVVDKNDEETDIPHYVEESNDGVYGESPMPEDRYKSLAEISAFEKANISFEEENIERNMSETIDNIIQNFKLLPDNRKESFIKYIMEEDNEIGNILNKIHNSSSDATKVENDKGDIEVYKKQIEELKQQLSEHNELKKKLEVLKETNENDDKEIKKEESDVHDVRDTTKENYETSSPSEEKNINNDEDSNTPMDIDTKLDNIMSHARSPSLPEKSETYNNEQVSASQPSSSFVSKSRNPISGDLANFRDSIANRSYKRAVRQINECVDLTKKYSEDIRKFNNEAEYLGFIDIKNDKTLNEKQKKEKMQELYNNNPSFMSLAKKVSNNGKKIPFLHEKIFDGLKESEKHGYDTSEAKRTYNDMISATNLEKPLVSPPSLKLEEIAKKIAEAVKSALAKLNNLFTKKDNVETFESSGPK